ncbi:MAG: aquaporin family protein [Hyphomicrobiaceae bacterium]|nr:aquaporin family protein [Hyphomicrobiaceae bacterium]
MGFCLKQRLAAEAIGTFFLLATVVGSGIMAERLAGGNVALALLGNTIPTGAILYVLITLFGPVSGAHFNPAVTLAFRLRGAIASREAVLFVGAQVIGGFLGVVAAHGMFAAELVSLSAHMRSGAAQGFSELIATFGLVLVILVAVDQGARSIPALVGLYITAAYWFTASTSFANPAVTLARAFTDSFSGIRLVDVPLFVAMQIAGALLAVALAGRLRACRKQAA